MLTTFTGNNISVIDLQILETYYRTKSDFHQSSISHQDRITSLAQVLLALSTRPQTLYLEIGFSLYIEAQPHFKLQISNFESVRITLILTWIVI